MHACYRICQMFLMMTCLQCPGFPEWLHMLLLLLLLMCQLQGGGEGVYDDIGGPLDNSNHDKQGNDR